MIIGRGLYTNQTKVRSDNFVLFEAVFYKLKLMEGVGKNLFHKKLSLLGFERIALIL